MQLPNIDILETTSKEKFQKIFNKMIMAEDDLTSFEKLMGISEKDTCVWIKKIKIITEDTILAVSVLSASAIIEPLVKIEKGVFEGFAFHEESAFTRIILHYSDALKEIAITDSEFIGPNLSVKIEKYEFKFEETEKIANKTVFIGHRGSGMTNISEYYIENTFHAFRNAFNRGAKWVELDVQLTKDEVPVIFHNLYVMVDDKKIPVASLNYEELKIYHEEKYYFSNNESKLTTLKEVLNHFDSFGFNVEIKYPMFHESIDIHDYQYMDPLNYVRKIVGNINFENKKIFFSSFNPQIIFALKLLDLKKPIYFLLDSTENITDVHHANSLLNAILFAKTLNIAGIVVVDTHLSGDCSELINFLHSLNLKILTYGDNINNPDEAKRLMSYGIDGIITDNLDSFPHYLSE
ncbi:hypothetical protein H312_03066 [Anncaliia algerae PRA339]|uniref:GP-PDE domain-containing protein n=1 Tax=Anncaliia algerae PRA339 TaxID=1288291 RepID=A0A059EXI1_9MICR|nr:hypothetical protein H312_03066 [Anncaliia algerae PRA339]